MPQKCPCGCDRNVPVLLDAVASAAASMIGILTPFIDPEAASRWKAPLDIDDETKGLVEFGENLFHALQDHLHGEFDLGAGQFVRDDAVDYELWLAKAAPALIRQLKPAPTPLSYMPDDDDVDHRLAHTT